MNCIVPCKAGSASDRLAGWSHTVALLYCIKAVRLLGEMRDLDLLLSHHTINDYLLYMSRMHQLMERIISQVKASEWKRMIPMVDSRDTKARKQTDYSRMFVDSAAAK